MYVSLPVPPQGIYSDPEIKVSLPELAVMMLVPVLPVAVKLVVPVNVKISRPDPNE